MKESYLSVNSLQAETLSKDINSKFMVNENKDRERKQMGLTAIFEPQIALKGGANLSRYAKCNQR
ncbi:MAG: hypothetical protein LBK61_00095 [Spirochaetaceae bacterium]|nr:hypothetical protein [Spirochaetaceae bacterium]